MKEYMFYLQIEATAYTKWTAGQKAEGANPETLSLALFMINHEYHY